jgi:archaemetzincin
VKEKEKGVVIGFKRGFHAPSESECEEALGRFADGHTPPEFFSRSSGGGGDGGGSSRLWFEPLRTPTHELDWLHQWSEPRQSVLSFRRTHPTERAGRDVLYLLPIGGDVGGWLVDAVVRFAGVFLGPAAFSRIAALPPVVALPRGLRTRVAHRYHTADYAPSHVQVAVDDLTQTILDARPPDARTVIGITMLDLHMDTTDEFTCGVASPDEKVGCFSFARYDPHFDAHARPDGWPGKEASAGVPEDMRRRVMIVRCCKVFVHEVMHLLGFGHCVYWNCLMCGSGHIPEDDAQPLRLCPIDLRKLCWIAQERGVALDVVAWYRSIADFLTGMALLPDEVQWIHERTAFIEEQRKK